MTEIWKTIPQFWQGVITSVVATILCAIAVYLFRTFSTQTRDALKRRHEKREKVMSKLEYQMASPDATARSDANQYFTFSVLRYLFLGNILWILPEAIDVIFPYFGPYLYLVRAIGLVCFALGLRWIYLYFKLKSNSGPSLQSSSVRSKPIISTQNQKEPSMDYPTLAQNLLLYRQSLGNLAEIHYFAPTNVPRLLEFFDKSKNLAAYGQVTASSQYQDRNASNILLCNRNSNNWTLDGGRGWIEIVWKPALSAKYILLVNRPTRDGRDPWGQATIFINGSDLGKFKHDFSGKMALVIYFSNQEEVEKLRFDIQGQTYPGLASLEAYA